MKVGIVGARGIGKHHAKWFSKAGCEVVAIYGTTEESVDKSAAGLRELMGFSGRAFHEWDRFLAEGGFTACSVCSPAESHAANVLDLAAAGKHILCEKPLAWDWTASPLGLIEDGTRMVEAAAHHGVILGMNAQYPAALDGFQHLYKQVKGSPPVFERLSFTMQTKGKPRSAHGAAEVWVDLGPHPVAFVDTVMPGGIDWATLRHTDEPMAAVLELDWISGERRLPVRIECRRTPEGVVQRVIQNQDLCVLYDGCNVDGEFRARLSAEGREWVGNDFMQVSIERFVEAVHTGDESRLLVDARAALRQQEALAGVWEHCWYSGRTLRPLGSTDGA